MNAIETINVYNTACMSPHCAASVPLSCMCPSRRKYIKSVDRRRVAYFKPGPTEGGRSPPPYNKCIVRLILRNDRSGSEKRGGPYIHPDAVRQPRKKVSLTSSAVIVQITSFLSSVVYCVFGSSAPPDFV